MSHFFWLVIRKDRLQATKSLNDIIPMQSICMTELDPWLCDTFYTIYARVFRCWLPY